VTNLRRISSIALIVTISVSISGLLAAQSKRPMTVDDFDNFQAVSGQQLSADGNWVAYTLKPRKGDGILTILNLTSGKHYTADRGSNPRFSSDSRWVAYTLIPHEKSDEEKRAERKEAAERKKAAEEESEEEEEKPEERNKLEWLELSSGEKVRIDRVQNYKFSENGKWVAYKLFKPDEKEAVDRPEGRSRGARGRSGARRTPGRKPGAGPASGGGSTEEDQKKKETGSDLVLHALNSGTDVQITEVAEYGFTDDSEWLYTTVSSKEDSQDGLFIRRLSSPGQPQALLQGKGKYQNFSWNKEKDRLLFLSDQASQEADHPLLALYGWTVGESTVEKLIDSKSTNGFPQGMELAGSAGGQRGNQARPSRPGRFGAAQAARLPRWSRDTSAIFFEIKKSSPEAAEEDDVDDESKPNLTIWHWKDVVIQSQQRVRATGRSTGSRHGQRRPDSGETYLCVYHLEDDRMVKLADEKMQAVNSPPNDSLGLGVDKSTYEFERPWSPTFNDFYLVDLETGRRKTVEMKTRWRYQWSGTGRYLLQYAQPDWWIYDVKSGEKRNLTQDLEVEFWNTDNDRPAPKNSWGMAGWTKDDEGVLVYDKYDIWYFPIAEPGDAACLTHGRGRAAESTFRYVSMDSEEEFIDTTRPLILSYVNNRNKASGIYDLRFGGEPRKLIVMDKRISSPRKAKDADVYLYSMSTFSEFGDLHVSDPTLNKPRKLTDANPENNGLLWGKTSLIDYTNLDGVKLQALLTLPEDYRKGEKYPMIVYVYEKLTRGLHQYSAPATGSGFPVPFFSSNGYVVLRPDIIYTDGFPGQSAEKCIIPAVQKVIDMGIADPDHVGMTGHSWGGYQTAHIITRTDIFACAYAGAPVSNMTSAYGGIRWGTGNPRTFQYETGQSRIGGSLWEYPERYIENSPIFFADRVNTPLMMLHGDEDTAVPWYQSIEYFLALRRLDKPVWFLQYNEEPHGLRGDANKKDFTIRRMQFFDHFLKGAPMPKWMKSRAEFKDRNQSPLTEFPPNR